MNRSQKREMTKEIKKQVDKYVSPKLKIVLADFSETTNTPLDYVEARYVQSGDKGTFIDDIKWVTECIKKGTHKFDEEMNFVKVENCD